MERILGLDVGTKTVGIAVSDPLGVIATGVETIRRTTPQADLTALQRVISLYNPSLLVVGYPKNMNGTVGDQARFVERYVEALKGAITIPIVLEDERLTTKIAHSAMIAMNVKAEKRRALIDQQAAAVILQGYLDRRSR